MDKYVCIRGRKYLNTTFRKIGKWNETNEHQDKNVNRDVKLANRKHDKWNQY